MDRNWIEQLFFNALRRVKPDFELTDETWEKLETVKDNCWPEIISRTEDIINKKAKQVLKNQRKDIALFKKSLVKRWGVAFDLLEHFIAFNLEYGMIVSESYRKNNKDVKFETLIRLHARSCQMSFEILELLKGGYADGALARWRSLYEITVISKFLRDKPEELCQKYLDYSKVEGYQEAIEFQKNYVELEEEPLSDIELKELEDEIQYLKTKYGEEFVKPYGWTAPYLDKSKRNFAGIESTLNIKYLRSYYKMANNYVHGGAKACLNVMGVYKQDKVMLAGPSNYGLADPAQLTALALFYTTFTLSGFEYYLEDDVYEEIAENMVSDIAKCFMGVQKQIEQEEDDNLEND